MVDCLHLIILSNEKKKRIYNTNIIKSIANSQKKIGVFLEGKDLNEPTVPKKLIQLNLI